MKKIPRSTMIPAVLLVYLAVMSYIGYGGYSSGAFGAWHYYGTIVGTLVVIFLLHLSLKRRDRLRRQRQDDIDNHTGVR